MSGVLLFVGLQLAGGIGHNFLLLHQHCAETLDRGIAKNLVRFGFIRRSQNWSSDQFLFQSVESNVTFWHPNILDVLLEEVGKRLCNLREILNESSTLACKPKETAELLDILRRLPIHNFSHLLGINSYALGGDDMPKVENLIEPKLAL